MWPLPNIREPWPSKCVKLLKYLLKISGVVHVNISFWLRKKNVWEALYYSNKNKFQCFFVFFKRWNLWIPWYIFVKEVLESPNMTSQHDTFPMVIHIFLLALGHDWAHDLLMHSLSGAHLFFLWRALRQHLSLCNEI